VVTAELPDYFHARYFDLRLGRFLSVDPVFDSRRGISTPQRWNRYAYALNNPLVRLDLDGRQDEMIVVNTLSAIAFDGKDRAALQAGVVGTQFEGKVKFVGPFARNYAATSYASSADSTDVLAIVIHSSTAKSSTTPRPTMTSVRWPA
jgi:RHS repeat-associated protein